MLMQILNFFDDDDKYRVYMRDSSTLFVEEKVGANPIKYVFRYVDWADCCYLNTNSNCIISFDAIEVSDFTIDLFYKGYSIATIEY